MPSKKKKHAEKPPEPRGPLLLVLETATGINSVALYEGAQLLGHADYHAGRLHAQLITVSIQQLLDNLSVKPEALSAIAVGRGPGSYTGLRVGVSSAKGLCMALDLPLLSVGSLEILAWSVLDLAAQLGAQIVPMIDARRMEVYCQRFDSHGQPQGNPWAQVVEAGSFAEILADGPTIFLGDGAEKCREILESEGGIVLGSRLSTASRLGKLIFQKYQAQEFEDLVTFEPFYLKNFVATVSKKKLL